MNKKQDKENKKVSDVAGFFENSLQELFEERKSIYVNYIQSRISSVVEGRVVTKTAGEEKDWEEIDSLSKLRALVGGRFQNLKSKWLAAGFPVKQDRGDHALSYSLNEKGWIDLSTWISNQGFEVRLNPEKRNVIFEIKQN